MSNARTLTGKVCSTPELRRAHRNGRLLPQGHRTGRGAIGARKRCPMSRRGLAGRPRWRTAPQCIESGHAAGRNHARIPAFHFRPLEARLPIADGRARPLSMPSSRRPRSISLGALTRMRRFIPRKKRAHCCGDFAGLHSKDVFRRPPRRPCGSW